MSVVQCHGAFSTSDGYLNKLNLLLNHPVGLIGYL